MIVAAHGNVDEYCAEHGMTIVERYEGNVADYSGSCLVLVTDNCADQNEYYYMKYKLMKRRIELVSTHWHDAGVNDFIAYLRSRDRRKSGGRLAFGYKRVAGVVVENPEKIAVVRKILEMRDAGATYREIANEVGIPVSTIQVILKNRSKYESD